MNPKTKLVDAYKAMVAFLFAILFNGRVMPSWARNEKGTMSIMCIILDVGMVAIGLPIAIGFIIAANTTGWAPILVTLWTYGLPSLLILLVVFVLFEEHKPKGS